MEQINVAMIPAVLAGIVKQLEAIDGWLTLKTEPVLNGTIGPQEDWIDIYELRRMIPGDPKIELVRSWLYFHGIPHYKSGRITLFRRQEIEAWIERAQRYGNGDSGRRSGSIRIEQMYLLRKIKAKIRLVQLEQ